MSGEDTAKSVMEGPPSRAERGAARLQVVFPLGLEQTIALGETPLVLGRRPEDGGHALDDNTVSRRHAEVSWASERHVFRDLGSRNGCRVGGERVADSPKALADGLVVRVGDVVMVYERGGAIEVIEPQGVSLDAVPGRAALIVRMRAAISAAAADPSPILVIGETGTGKEFIAREIHRLSCRPGPFVAVNCAALSPQLIESQLFGHVRGAFTGAHRDEPGLFRAAHGGTILLDEIGELPLELQAKLLRVLQEREVLPVGATRPVSVDARVVAVTLRDLPKLCDSGSFRLDLYSRLSIWELRVPALRQRRADILRWLERLDRDWLLRRGLPATEAGFEANAVERLLLYDWPDNLRGIDRLVHLVRSDPAQTAYDLPAAWCTDMEAGDSGPDDDAAKPASRRTRLSKDELVQALEKNGGSVRATAKDLGRERRLIYRWMDLYGLREK